MKSLCLVLLILLLPLPLVLHSVRGGTRQDGFRKSALQSIADASPRGFKILFPLCYLAAIILLLAKLMDAI